MRNNFVSAGRLYFLLEWSTFHNSTAWFQKQGMLYWMWEWTDTERGVKYHNVIIVGNVRLCLVHTTVANDILNKTFITDTIKTDFQLVPRFFT